MVAVENFLYLVGSLVGGCLGKGGGKDALYVVDGEDALHHGGVGRKHNVVLVLTHAVVAFRLQHTDDCQRYGVEPDYTAHGVASVGKQLVDHRLAHYAHLGGALDVEVGKRHTVLHLQLADFKIVGIDALHLRRVVVGAADKLSLAAYHRRHRGNEFCLVADVLEVDGLHRLHVVAALLHAAALHVAGKNHYHVASHL